MCNYKVEFLNGWDSPLCGQCRVIQMGGEVAERLKARHWKCRIWETVSRVQIPPSPPTARHRYNVWRVTRKGAGPCAIETFEPRQVRKEATVRRRFCVPQDHLAP